MGQAADKLLDRLHKGGLTLLVERDGHLAHASDRSGLRPLWDGIIEHPEIFDGADVADKVIGLAAAYLLIYARAARVATPVITKEAEKAFLEAKIQVAFDTKIKQLHEDTPLPDGAGIEELAKESVSAATFVEALRARYR